MNDDIYLYSGIMCVRVCVRAKGFLFCGGGGCSASLICCEDYLVEMRRGYLSFDDIKWNYIVKLWFLMVDYRSGARESKRRRWTTWYCSTRAPMTSYSPRLPNTNSSHPPFSPIVWGYFFFTFLQKICIDWVFCVLILLIV